MKRLLALASAAGDRLNPVAVKEFRQAVQNRWVVTILMLFLLINLGVVGGYVMLSPTASTSIDGGRNIFTSLLVILLITCVGFVPAYAAIRLSFERNDANTDLLFVTTITPGKIVRGKYLTAMTLTLLIFSACMPFMILTYLLRGIDLPTIFLVLADAFIVCATANAMGIFAGAVSGSWLIRGLVDTAAVFVLFYATAMTIGMAESLLMFGRGGMGGIVTWTGMGMYLLIEFLVIGLFYVLSVALLSPKPSNRMLVPRLYLTGCWLLTAVVALVWSYCVAALWPLTAWMVICGICLTILTVAALGERDTWSARMRRTIPRNPLLRLAAFPLYTGSAGGILWCVLLFVATILVARGWVEFSGHMSGATELESSCANMSLVFGYVLCYCLTTAFFRTTVLRTVPTVNLSVTAAFLGVAVCFVPYLVAFFRDQHAGILLPWYLLGSPMVLTTSNQAAKDAAGPFVLGWLMLAVLLSTPWMMGQWRRFAPYDRTPAPQGDVETAGANSPAA